MSTKAIFVFLIVLSVTVLVGGILGFGYAYLQITGWFVNWDELESLPGKPSEILMIDGDQVWIQTVDGKIFWNSSSYDCTTNCWSQVDNFPEAPAKRGEYMKILPETCSPPPPIFGLVDQRGECEKTGLYEISRVYAIRSNGKIMFWKADTGNEWSGVLAIMDTAIGMFLSLFVGIPLALSKASKQER